MSWRQPVCGVCWEVREPLRIPVRLKRPEEERCAFCGSKTTSGIYVRADPDFVPYPRYEGAR